MKTSSNLRWEFLRRNPRYRGDYAALLEKLGVPPEVFDRKYRETWHALKMKADDEVARLFPNISLKTVKQGFFEIARFLEKWPVARPADPEQLTGPEFLDVPSSAGSPVELLTPGQRMAEPSPDHLLLRIFWKARMPEILAQIESLLATHQALNLEETLDFAEPQGARLLQALEVYDQVHQNQKNLETIAAELPDDSSTPAWNRERKLAAVKDLLQEAHSQIENAGETAERP